MGVGVRFVNAWVVAALGFVDLCVGLGNGIDLGCASIGLLACGVFRHWCDCPCHVYGVGVVAIAYTLAPSCACYSAGLAETILAGVAVAGFGEGSSELARELAQRGASRICAPGTLQAPPLDWRHEGRGVLLPLTRFADRETPRAE